jgi:hypothetical protein
MPAQRMILHAMQHGVDCLRSYDGDQLSLIRNIQRIEPQDFANSLHAFPHGKPIFVQKHADLRLECNLVEGSRQASYGMDRNVYPFRLIQMASAYDRGRDCCYPLKDARSAHIGRRTSRI